MGTIDLHTLTRKSLSTWTVRDMQMLCGTLEQITGIRPAYHWVPRNREETVNYTLLRAAEAREAGIASVKIQTDQEAVKIPAPGTRAAYAWEMLLETDESGLGYPYDLIAGRIAVRFPDAPVSITRLYGYAADMRKAGVCVPQRVRKEPNRTLKIKKGVKRCQLCPNI